MTFLYQCYINHVSKIWKKMAQRTPPMGLVVPLGGARCAITYKRMRHPNIFKNWQSYTKIIFTDVLNKVYTNINFISSHLNSYLLINKLPHQICGQFLEFF